MARKKKRDHDFSITAFRVVQEATGQIEPKVKEPKKIDYAAIGRIGGLKGGKARAEKLTLEQRKEIASKAAKVRWANQDQG